MPTFIIHSCFPSFGFKVTQWDMYVEKDFNRLFCGDCRQTGFSRSTPIKVVFLQFKPEFDTAECVQCWLRPTGMNAPVADPHLTAAFLTTRSFHTPLLLNVLLMVAPVGGLQMHVTHNSCDRSTREQFGRTSHRFLLGCTLLGHGTLSSL